MSVVIHAQVRSCFAVSFRHFEFCISSQSGQQCEMTKEPCLGVLVGEMAEKRKTLSVARMSVCR